MPYKVKTSLLLAVVLLVVLSTLISGCASEEVDNFSKLDFHVKELINAYEQGKAEEYVQQYDLEFSEEGVTIIVECETGKAESVANKASEVGATDIRFRNENNWVKAVVPINNLTVLADIPGVKLLRLPWYPVENE